MKLTKELTEVLGIFAADGCLQDNYICMWGNITEDREYYDNVVCPLFSKIFNKEIKAHEKKSNSVYGFYVCNKNAINLLKSFGFKRNKTYSVSVPKEIMKSKNKKIISAFIRGYADCDGNINFLKRRGKYRPFKTKYNTYPRIEIVSVSHQVIKEISQLLRKLDVKHRINLKRTTKENEKDKLAILIRGPERVGDYMKKVGFNNSAHISKYEIWKNFKICPARTTIQQRNLILDKKLDPFSLYN